MKRLTQSLSGLVRQNLADIERQIEIGIPIAAIVDGMQKVGHEITIATFNTALYRARKRVALKAAASSNWQASTGVVRQQPAGGVRQQSAAQAPKRVEPITQATLNANKDDLV